MFIELDEETKLVDQCKRKAMDECVKSIDDSYVSTVPRYDNFKG